MRFSEAWLREWVNPPITTEQLADQLSMAGLEVDAVESAAAAFSGVVVGAVLARESHPDADKLSVCRVDIGQGAPVQIVCGAKNVAAGMRVPVATVGGVLPGDFSITEVKLRGIDSLGMICSAKELGLAESSEGILPLAADAPVGTDMRVYMDLDDQCIEVDLTPDRGDCLSLAGIAREVGVLNRIPLSPQVIAAVAVDTPAVFPVEVAATSACPRYLCRVLEGIDAGAATPAWMVERLRRSGIRAISPVVDVTNYVMLELGQPMHGFDLGKLVGGIHVRMAVMGEKIQLLDGSEQTLRDDTLVIADRHQPVALAGIMGGELSGVSTQTRDVLLESAFFAPLAVAGKARSYGLHTDSSHRFERGVDFRLQRAALERATALLLDIVGGRAGAITEVVSSADLPERAPIALRRTRVERLLGVQIADQTIADILQRLDMHVVEDAAGWQVCAPSARFDITIEVDLIEEIARIYGYANIPARLTSTPVSIATRKENGFDLAHAKQMLVDRDYQEAITYSFVSPELAALVTPDAEQIRLANPISADMAVMRASLWPGLLATLRYNLARQQDRVRLFESGLTFVRVAGELVQRGKFGAVVYGAAAREQWGEATRKADFFDLKGDLESILSQVGPWDAFCFTHTANPALHPGQSACIEFDGAVIGWIGALHPSVQKALDLPTGVYMFEVDLPALDSGRLPAFQSLSKFPAIRRDLAIVVGREVAARTVLDCVRAAAPENVKDIQLFDVYTGENVDSSLKSLALSLILQEYSHTLTDEEVDAVSACILDSLATTLGAKLRE